MWKIRTWQAKQIIAFQRQHTSTHLLASDCPVHIRSSKLRCFLQGRNHCNIKHVLSDAALGSHSHSSAGVLDRAGASSLGLLGLHNWQDGEEETSVSTRYPIFCCLMVCLSSTPSLLSMPSLTPFFFRPEISHDDQDAILELLCK